MPAFFTPFSGAEVFKEKERGNVAAVIRKAKNQRNDRHHQKFTTTVTI
jgi:hypothetical protein